QTLQYGSSIPWQDQLEHLTGSKQVKSDAIVEYFRPLYDWLVLDNIVHKEKIGWNEAEINWIDE
ncbi:angiotensin-converting enzyme, partial [Biomphalaria glabrata]